MATQKRCLVTALFVLAVCGHFESKLSPFIRKENSSYQERTRGTLRSNTVKIAPLCYDWSTCNMNPDYLCNYSVSMESQAEFEKKVLQSNNLIYLRLNIDNDTTVNATKCVIAPTEWVWTPIGQRGDELFLKLPIGFDVWSAGTLNYSVTGPIDIAITHEGNCNLLLGEPESTIQLARAFITLGKGILDNPKRKTNDLGSYFCYRERVYIPSNFLYRLCLHFVCPAHAMGYRCCHYEPDRPYTIHCDPLQSHYEFWWWLCPFILGIMLCAFFPLPLMSTTDRAYRYLRTQEHTLLPQSEEEKPLLIHGNDSYCSLADDIEMVSRQESTAPVNRARSNSKDRYILETNVRPVTVVSICASQIMKLFSFRTVVISRIIRALFPLCTFSLVALNVYLLYLFDNDFVVEAAIKGVPMGFPSILASHKVSSSFFLRYFGGPYLACMVYITVGAVLIAFPRDFGLFLQSALQDNTDISTSLLTLDRKTIQKYGCHEIRKRQGYGRVYSQMSASCFMLLNFSFWKYAICMQVQRWKSLLIQLENSCNKFVAAAGIFFTFAPYIMFCSVEISLAIVYYGLPIMNFTHTFVRAYFRNTEESLKRIKLFRIGRIFVAFVVAMPALFVMYIFSIVFVDSFLFLTRVVIYTYTGVFANPVQCYGYVVFLIWVIYYLWECVNKVGNVYQELLKNTILLSQSLKPTDSGTHEEYFVYIDGIVGIHEELFEYVINKRKPRMKELFVSAVKVAVIIIVILFSVNIFVSYSGTHKMSLLTHIFEAVFICMIPKLVTSCYTGGDKQIVEKYYRHELKQTILEFWKSRKYLRQMKREPPKTNDYEEV